MANCTSVMCMLRRMGTTKESKSIQLINSISTERSCATKVMDNLGCRGADPITPLGKFDSSSPHASYSLTVTFLSVNPYNFLTTRTFT